MRQGVKLFATFNGISPEAFAKLRPLLCFDEVEYSPDTVHIEHSAYCDTVDELVIAVAEVMKPGAESGLDIIDHDANTVTRFVIDSAGFRSRTLNLDDVVEAYPTHSPHGV